MAKKPECKAEAAREPAVKERDTTKVDKEPLSENKILMEKEFLKNKLELIAIIEVVFVEINDV